MLYSYVYLHTTLHREYFLILRFEFSKFSRLKSWLYYYRTHARSKWEILQPSLDLTIAKKKITENATRYYSYFSRGQTSIFWWMQHVYICWGFFFLVEFVYFYELKNPWSKKEVEKKIVHENSCSKCSQKSYFWGYLFIFRATCLIKNPPFRLSIDL